MHGIVHGLASVSHQTLESYGEAQHVLFDRQTENSIQVFCQGGSISNPHFPWDT